MIIILFRFKHILHHIKFSTALFFTLTYTINITYLLSPFLCLFLFFPFLFIPSCLFTLLPFSPFLSIPSFPSSFLSTLHSLPPPLQCRNTPRLREFAEIFAVPACEFGDAIRHGFKAEPPATPHLTTEEGRWFYAVPWSALLYYFSFLLFSLFYCPPILSSLSFSTVT